MRAPAKAPRQEKGQSAALWFGVLAGPAAWVTHVAAGYILEDTACSPGSTSEAILGIAIEPLYTALTGILAFVTFSAGLTAWRCRRRIGEGVADVPSERARWMARAGVIVSALFFVIIALEFAAIWILSACEAPL